MQFYLTNLALLTSLFVVSAYHFIWTHVRLHPSIPTKLAAASREVPPSVRRSAECDHDVSGLEPANLMRGDVWLVHKQHRTERTGLNELGRESEEVCELPVRAIAPRVSHLRVLIRAAVCAALRDESTS
ncbi:hypothetical protein DFH06DRAFT_1140967 [Mycena polygramma]|nr:hypothetical protein DFH06DRAFT_1140967 [Mycena polygramma]